jgi:hypothetical protein
MFDIFNLQLYDRSYDYIIPIFLEFTYFCQMNLNRISKFLLKVTVFPLINNLNENMQTLRNFKVCSF